MPTVTLEVRNPSGLHARPAAMFVQAAARFEADVTIANLDRDPHRTAPARSLLAVLALGISHGHHIQLEAKGTDAGQALAALQALVESGLGEPMAGAAES